MTFDKDFAALCYAGAGRSPPGVILVRWPEPPARALDRIAEAIASRSDWRGAFASIDPETIRLRPLKG